MEDTGQKKVFLGGVKKCTITWPYGIYVYVEVIFVNAVTAGGGGVNFSIFTHFFVFLSLNC